LASVIIFGLPLLDTLLAIVRRKLAGRPIFSPDAGHFHHFLLKRGLSVKKAALLSYLIAFIFVGFAFIIVLISTLMAIALYMVLLGCLVVVAFKIGIVSWTPKSSGAMMIPSPTHADSDSSAPPHAFTADPAGGTIAPAGKKPDTSGQTRPHIV
jgi:UDP-GlcNAc:undecaprenyl-phosphate GlcNAc-1-phosphate transferase